MRKLLLLLTFINLTFLQVKAQAVQWAFMQNTVSSPITSDGKDLISFGRIVTSLTIGGQTMAGNNGRNCYLAKYDTYGTALWAKHIQGNVSNTDVTTDLHKNIIITGQFWDSLYIGNLVFKNPRIYSKFFIAKFDQAGNFLWARTTNPVGLSGTNTITTDGVGNIYAAGFYRDTISIGTTTHYPIGFGDIFLVKYDTNGNFQWLNSIGDAGYENDPIITGGLTNDVYVSAKYSSNVTTGPRGYFLKKFNNVGQEQWSKFINDQRTSLPAYLTTDAAENIYMASLLDTVTLTFGSHVLNYQAGNPNNIFLAKITPSGNWKWARKIQTWQVTNWNFSMVPEKKNELNIMHSNFTGTGQQMTSNFYISTLDTAGTILKTNSFQGKTFFHPTDIFLISDFATDNAGNTYMAGAIAGNNTLGTINLNAPPSIPGAGLPSPSAGFIAKILDNANTVTGNLFIDSNGNGLKDTGELPYENGMIAITSGPGYATSAANGTYTMFVPAGTFNLQVAQPANHYTFLPQNHSVTFTGLGQNQTKDFALVPIPNRNDVKVTVTNLIPSRQGRTIKYRLTYQNVGTTTLSDTITLKYASNFLTYTASSISPASQQAGKLRWFYQPLQPTETRNIDVEFTVAASTPINTKLSAVAIIKPLATDYIPANNYDSLNHVVVGSYDPNDKQVSFTSLTPSQVASGKLLDYVIRFQNTGNDTAFTVVVRDSISSKLNMTSFELLSASHPYTFKLLDNGMAEWRFENILLPDSTHNKIASHGFIRYRIKPKNNLVLGDEIRSRAAIYFDYNAAVMTNYAITGISNVSGIKEGQIDSQKFALYPNPAKNYVMVAAELKKQASATVILRNLLGQTISEVILPVNNQIYYQLPLNGLAKGVYIVQLETEAGQQTQRLVIQ